MQSLEAALFDFDGTLADSYPAITASVNHVRERHGLPLMTIEQVRPYVGRGAESMMEDIVPGCDPALCLQMYRQHHPSVMYEKTTLLPGAETLLTALHRAGVKIGLCSNKPRFYNSKLLAHLGLANMFSLILGPEDVPRPKPAPDMLHEALQRLQVSVDRTLYVGDMSVDIETARGAGVTVWVVPTGSESRDMLQSAAPDRLLEGLGDMIDLLSLN